MTTQTKQTVSLKCVSNAEASTIRIAVSRYGKYLQSQGTDLRNYVPASAGVAGFGWGTVQRAAGDMAWGSTTYVSRRLAGAIRVSLVHLMQTSDSPNARFEAQRLIDRIDAF